MSKLLTRCFVMPILNTTNPSDMQTNNINNKLQAQLSRDIEQRKRLLEKRAFAHAQTIFPIEELNLEPPDYGLGVIPKLTAVDNANNEALRIIDKCNAGVIKLSVMQRLLKDTNTHIVLKFLNDNQYHMLSLDTIKEKLGAKQATVEEILYS